MGLTLYNTLTRSKQAFAPIDPANVRMYVCGPTVYDYAHIGNARPLIVFDVLFRLLEHLAKQREWDGGKGETKVTYVRNITDVDDKINARAAEEFPDLALNEAIRKVTTRTTEQFHADVKALGCLPPTFEPRATDYIDRPEASEDMLRLIGKLIDGGHAYAAEGHVLFDVKSWKAADGSPEYGKLSRRSLDDMIAGARVEVAPYKKDPMDFVLWKPSKPGEPAWDSPWGAGRPGWHLECSAMAGALLGDTFDIHGGGIDLAFPHHENEIAQSRCAHGTAVMANFWLHNGFLQVEGEKMSKSLGNFITIRDLLSKWRGEVLRFNMLRSHYREPLNWTQDSLNLANNELSELEFVALDYSDPEIDQVIIEFLSDDLNTPKARARLFELKKQALSGTASAGRKLRWGLELLGFGGAVGDWRGVALNQLLLFGTDFAPPAARGIKELSYSLPKELFWGTLKREIPDLMHKVVFVKDEVAKEFLSILQSISDNCQIYDLRSLSEEEIAKIPSLIAARATARAEKNWAEADRIRDELDAMGIALKDAKDPETGELVTTWEVKR